MERRVKGDEGLEAVRKNECHARYRFYRACVVTYYENLGVEISLMLLRLRVCRLDLELANCMGNYHANIEIGS